MANQSSIDAARDAVSRNTPPAGRTSRALAFLSISWERLWPLTIPAFITLCLFLIVSWFGVWRYLGEVPRWSLVAIFVFVFLLSLFPLLRMRFPSREAVLRRIEQVSGLEHRPVTAQTDRIAGDGGDFGAALWAEHQRRMAARLTNLASGAPRPDANRFDRYALRAILPLFVFAAFGYSYSLDGGRLSDAIKPHVDREQVLSRLDAWITPPGYTGKPPLYLSKYDPQSDGVIETLTGSELTIRYFGDAEITAQFVGKAEATPFTGEQTAIAGSRETAFIGNLTEDGIIELSAGDTPIASWPVSVLPDLPPEISFADIPATNESGALELAYSLLDDYGVVSAQGLVAPVDGLDENARPLVGAPELPLPLPRPRTKEGTTKVSRDFSDHPWAGSEVLLTLEAADDAGQTGRSQPFKVTLPGRNFFDPMAKALIEQRRVLAMDANKAPYVSDLLEAVSSHPEIFDIDPSVYIGLRSTYRRLVSARSDDHLREGMDMLWEIALAIELGDLSEVERRLREAQEKLSEALENGASDEEIERLMEELREAMADFLEQLARQMAQNPTQQNPINPMQDMRMMTERDFERMMDRIEDLAKSGSRDAARELLAEMQRMMDSLRAGQHQQQRQAEGNELNQALDKLSELMAEQERLMNETFSMQRRQPDGDQQGQQRLQNPNQRQGQQQQGQQQQGQQGDDQGPMTPEEFAEAMRQLQQQQEALQQQLGELGEQLEGLGLDPSREFDEAGREMGEAGENLGQGRSGEAAGDQSQALQALRQGAQSMMQQMAGDRGEGGQQQGQVGQVGDNQRGTDPLGRRTGPRGQINDEATRIPGEIDAQRAREIMEAIRKRLSDPLRPLIERDYLERLLRSE